MRGRCIVTLVAIVFLFIPCFSFAQNDDQLSENHYKLGADLYKRSAFAEALNQFQLAYGLSPRAPLLYNMARCNESLGSYEEAVKLYQQYLAHKPPKAARVKAKIASLKRLISRTKKVKHDQAPLPQAQIAPNSVSQPEVASPQPPKKTVHHTPVSPIRIQSSLAEPMASSSPRPLKMAGWTTLGVGLGAGITGIILGVLAKSKQLEVEEAAKNKGEYTDIAELETSGRHLQIGQIVGLVTGGVFVTTGIILLILHKGQSPARQTPWVSPHLSSSGAMILSGFSF